MSGWRWIVVQSAIAALLICAVAVEPSLAAPSKLGENIGGELSAIGKGVFLAIAGLAGIAAYGARDFSKLSQIFVVSVTIGGFLFVPTKVQAVIEGIWNGVA